jgi:tetratricopeptide (TPR) repeat protein
VKRRRIALGLIRLSLVLAFGTLASALFAGNVTTVPSPRASPSAVSSTAVPQSAGRQRRELSADVVEQAKEVQERADTVIFDAQLAVGILSLVVILVYVATVFVGYQEVGRVEQAKKNAEDLLARLQESVSKIKQSETEIDKIRERLRATDDAVKKSIEATKVFYQDTPAEFKELLGLVGELGPIPNPTAVARFEELDIQIVVADQNNSVEKDKLIDPFLRLGSYWRIVGNQTRAIARFQRAVELDPDGLDARHGLCRALYNLAFNTKTPRVKANLLDWAQLECDAERSRHPNHPLVWFDQGWIYDERGDYPQAVQAYQEGQRLDEGGIYTNLTYNLVCSLVKSDRLREACDAFKKILHVPNAWEDALGDDDLEKLRASPYWGELKTLRAETIRRSSSSS